MRVMPAQAMAEALVVGRKGGVWVEVQVEGRGEDEASRGVWGQGCYECRAALGVDGRSRATMASNSPRSGPFRAVEDGC